MSQTCLIPYTRRVKSFILAAYVIAFYLFLPFSPATAASYTYDQNGSRITFTLTHLGIVTVTGDFKKFAGDFTFDPQNVSASKVVLTIQSGSLETGLRKRDSDLKSKKFFWTDQYSEIKFISKEFKDVEGKTFNIYGDLTIRGKTVPVVFHTELLTGLKEIVPGKSLRFQAYTFIRRKDFGLGTGGIFDPILMITGETLKISLEVEGRAVKPEA